MRKKRKKKIISIRQKLVKRKLINMRKIVLLFILFITFISNSFAHPGRTDSNGGHYDRSTGEYHYHNGGYIEENIAEDNTSGKLKVNDTYINDFQKEIDNKQNTTTSLQEQIYSKQNTISRLCGLVLFLFSY